MLEISVIMPVYNEANYLKDAIESILNQTFTDFEFIIIDDGSVDDSSKIIKSYKDTRIRFFESEHKRIVNQLNFGIVNSRAPLIARMDADDISENRRFEKQYNFLLENPDVDIVGTNFISIKESGKVVGIKKYPEYHNDIKFIMPVESAVCHPSVIFRKEILENINLYKPEYETAEDHELFSRLMIAGNKFHNIQEPLYKYRLYLYSNMNEKIRRQNALSYKIGTEYLLNDFSPDCAKSEKYDYYFRMGLIEYYRGSISLSRKFFINAWMSSKHKLFKILRYFSVTLLGHNFIHFLRKRNFLPKFSLYLNKITKFDLHRIRK